jgi:hypothetical protein
MVSFMMTLREYFTTRYAPQLVSVNKHTLAFFDAAIAFLEEHLLYNRSRLNVLKVCDADLDGMVNAAIRQGYSVRTAKNWTQAIRRILRECRPEEFPVGGQSKEVSYPPPADPPSRRTPMLVYMRYVYFADRPRNRNYERSLWCAIDKLGESLHEEARLRHFNDASVAGMLSLCRKQGLCENTIRLYRKSIRSLWRHAAVRGLVAYSKDSKVLSFDCPRKLPGEPRQIGRSRMRGERKPSPCG